MRWPHVEGATYRDLARLYYDRPYSKRDSRSDVTDGRFVYSEVLFDTTMLGGDRADVLDATVLHMSWMTLFDLRISRTSALLRDTAAALDVGVDASLLDELAARAVSTLDGVALFGAFRALAWAAFSNGVLSSRRELSARAAAMLPIDRAHVTRSSVAADDAHAHLRYAMRIDPSRVPNEEGEIEAYRQVVLDRGFLLLAAAIAHASTERWNPFTRRRMRAELDEHIGDLTHITDQGRRQYLEHVVDEATKAFDAVFIDLDAAYAERMEEDPDDDIEHYFSAGSAHDLASPPLGPPTPIVSGLMAGEPGWRRYV